MNDNELGKITARNNSELRDENVSLVNRFGVIFMLGFNTAIRRKKKYLLIAWLIVN